MIDLNAMVNEHIMKERLLARSELAGEILHMLEIGKSPTQRIQKVLEVQERLSIVREEYYKYKSGIPF